MDFRRAMIIAAVIGLIIIAKGGGVPLAHGISHLAGQLWKFIGAL